MDENFYDLDRYDPDQDPAVLLQNVHSFAEILKSPQTPIPTDNFSPTISFILGVDVLLCTHDPELQLELARLFVYSFRLSIQNGTGVPICEGGDLLRHMFRFFNRFYGSGLNPAKIELLKISNEMNLYALAAEDGIETEVFSEMIQIKSSDVVLALIKMINECDRLSTPMIYEMCKAVTEENPQIGDVLNGIQQTKQYEFVQGIKSYYRAEEDDEPSPIAILSMVDELINIDPLTMFGYIEGELAMEDDKTRIEATTLAARVLAKPNFIPTSWNKYEAMIARHADKIASLRVIVVDFAFRVLEKLASIRVSSSTDVFENTRARIVQNVWDAMENRIVDPATEVRVTVMENLAKMRIEDIKLNREFLAERMKDKVHDVRILALELMLRIYEKDSARMNWLIETLISMYSTLKAISVYGVSCVISKHSVVEVAEQLRDRREFMNLLRDTNEFRTWLPLYEEERAQAVLKKYIELPLLKKLMKKVPSGFFDKALDQKKRPKLFEKVKAAIQKMKGKLPEDIAYLLMGLYQPCPLHTDDLMACTDLEVLDDLSKIFAVDFEPEVPRLLENLTEPNLIILANMKNVDFDDKTRSKILKALIPLTACDAENRALALKTFTKIYTPNYNKLLGKIKFSDDDDDLKIEFYARIGLYSPELVAALPDMLPNMNSRIVKYGLRLACLVPGQEAIDILMAAVTHNPVEAFTAYITNAHALGEWNTPEVFRTFAYTIQHPDCDIRTRIIAALGETLIKRPKTPVQFLSVFALSATDPHEPNVFEAKKRLEGCISKRRQIIKKLEDMKREGAKNLAPESTLPYLIHLLAHHEDMDRDNSLDTFAVYLRFFLAPLCAEATHIDGIFNTFWQLGMLEDKEGNTDNMVKLCDLAASIVKDLAGGRDWGAPEDLPFEYSTRYFQPAESPRRLQQLMKQKQSDQLRSPVRSPKSSAILRAGMSPRIKSLKTKRPAKLTKLADFDESESEESSEEERPKRSAPASPARRKKAETHASSAAASPRRSPRRCTSPTTSGKSNR